jgi:tight adherence protein C
MIDIVEAFNDPSTVAGVLLAGAVFATVVTLAQPLAAGERLSQRMKSVGEQRERLRKRSRKEIGAGANLRLNEGTNLQSLVERFNLEKLVADDTLASKLAQAGLRGSTPTSIYYLCRVALPFVFALIAFAVTRLESVAAHVDGSMGIGVIAAAFGLGFYAPTLYLGNLIAKRRQSIMRAFPDALDMLLICIESGMSIEVAMGRVSQEIGAASIELAEEFALCMAELSYLPERRQAYENLGRRTDHPGVKSVSMALVQAERYGTPLGQALRVMAKENRDLRMNEAEKKAASLPAKLTVPMIAFFLPVLCVILVAPAGIQVAQTMGN